MEAARGASFLREDTLLARNGLISGPSPAVLVGVLRTNAAKNHRSMPNQRGAGASPHHPKSRFSSHFLSLAFVLSRFDLGRFSHRTVFDFIFRFKRLNA